MRRTAKVFMNNRIQAVRLPREFQFTTSEVFIRKRGEAVILSPVNLRLVNFRIVSAGEGRTTGGMTAAMRLPSGS